VCAGQFVPDLLKERLHSALLDGLERDPVNAGSPVLLLGPASRLREGFPFLQTWTYRPQKRQAVSAFAWCRSSLLRSCRLMGVFIISPLPPVLSEEIRTAGLLRSTGVTPFRRYCEPTSATLSSSAEFPVVPVIRLTQLPPFSGRDEEGFSSCSTYPGHRAVATTPPERPTASIGCGEPCSLRPHGCGRRPPDYALTGPPRVHSRYGPTTPRSPEVRLSRGFRPSVSLRPASSYGASDSYPAGLLPAGYVSLSWTHNRACNFSLHTALQFVIVAIAARRVCRHECPHDIPCRQG